MSYGTDGTGVTRKRLEQRYRTPGSMRLYDKKHVSHSGSFSIMFTLIRSMSAITHLNISDMKILQNHSNTFQYFNFSFKFIHCSLCL